MAGDLVQVGTMHGWVGALKEGAAPFEKGSNYKRRTTGELGNAYHRGNSETAVILTAYMSARAEYSGTISDIVGYIK
jgi:hypothetical protein